MNWAPHGPGLGRARAAAAAKAGARPPPTPSPIDHEIPGLRPIGVALPRHLGCLGGRARRQPRTAAHRDGDPLGPACATRRNGQRRTKRDSPRPSGGAPWPPAPSKALFGRTSAPRPLQAQTGGRCRTVADGDRHILGECVPLHVAERRPGRARSARGAGGDRARAAIERGDAAAARRALSQVSRAGRYCAQRAVLEESLKAMSGVR
jgi:hypothetical protein